MEEQGFDLAALRPIDGTAVQGQEGGEQVDLSQEQQQQQENQPKEPEPPKVEEKKAIAREEALAALGITEDELNENSKLAKQFKNMSAIDLELLALRETGGLDAIKDFVEMQSMKIDEMNDVDVIISEMKTKYPAFSKEQLKSYLAEQLNVSVDELDELDTESLSMSAKIKLHELKEQAKEALKSKQKFNNEKNMADIIEENKQQAEKVIGFAN
jgi:energy-converting hydrogenase A subunit M